MTSIRVRRVKSAITQRVILDDVLHRENQRQLVIYSRADGSRFIRDWQGQKAVHEAEDGSLYYEQHIRTVRKLTIDDILADAMGGSA